jgi:hypothetical protein
LSPTDASAFPIQRLYRPPPALARKGFVERFGENVFELEAIPPATLQQYLREAIDDVLDLKAFNAEIDREKEDAAYLDTVRNRAHAMLGELGTS